MCTHDQCFRAKRFFFFFIFHLKINIFTVVKYCCILHGRVCIMIAYLIRFREIEMFLITSVNRTFFKCGSRGD